MSSRSSTLVYRVRLVLLLGGIALATSCGGGGDGGAATTQAPTEPAQPPVQPTVPAAVPGTLTARLVTPHTDDGAILLDITGPAPATDFAAAAPGAVVYAKPSGNTTRVAVFGSIGSGPLIRFSVPDVNAAQQYSAQVAEASDRASALRTSVTGYQITFAP